MAAIQGTLIPIGGNEVKAKNEKRGLDFVQEGILAHVVRESGGKDAKIIIIPTASSIPKIVGANYLCAFKELGCTNTEVVFISKKKHCSDPEVIRAFETADCVMFTGGDQSKIIKHIGGTPVHIVLSRKYREEKFVIAGTSAGAMAMAQDMIAGGSSTESLVKGALILSKGLGLIPGLIIDTHFIQRGRFGRLAEAVAIHPRILGIGLAEDTGVIIKNGLEFKVIGSGMVIIMDALNLTHNAHKLLKPGTPMSMSNLTTHILANGDRFELTHRSITILPIHEKFV